MKVAGLYAGIGGFELGLARASHRTVFLSEIDADARIVLQHRFPGVNIDTDVLKMSALPKSVDVITAGFPCQDLSMAGTKKGLRGEKSKVVEALFRLLSNRPIPWVVIENVYFMLHLAKGAAMDHIVTSLEALGYRWASRVVDSRAFGLPQRRRRVFFVASLDGDPRNVLLTDNSVARSWPPVDLKRPIGFYWTEGRSGHGLTSDAIPPLKSGSSIGIPSPPAVLLPDGRVVTPTIEAIERFQGFPPRWSSKLEQHDRGRHRWRLVGNAVSIPVAEWIGKRLIDEGDYDDAHDRPLVPGERWPSAAWNMGESRMVSSVSEYPLSTRRGRISAYSTENWPDLSERALSGFIKRARGGHLNFPSGFIGALEENLQKRP